MLEKGLILQTGVIGERRDQIKRHFGITTRARAEKASTNWQCSETYSRTWPRDVNSWWLRRA